MVFFAIEVLIDR